ncbi:magnesium and cobalt transport protein CorA [Curtobacterium sp. MCLR17_036]|uniref:magnesium and cobalt transport protein CorA n=1 Tax=Curtobacterium sp. MCLR17_036 TaxID=2175620 RepID=UPI000DAA3532|nr:magnesium and cobalt transport protein CorA [Curtobacterium sp. MCLR17_036]WIE65292.1 magnesium and cobalt transport protein CorA [Curtobacterium sp. MCLR17_036]
MALIDNAIYVRGRRVESPASPSRPVGGDLTWIGLLRPDARELDAVAAEFDLHENAVEDAAKGHQRAKLERYGDTLFVVLRPAWYEPTAGAVAFGEVHLFVGDRFVVSVRHADRPDLGALRARVEQDPDFLARGSEAVTAAVLDEVVDGYGPVVEVLQDQIDTIEDQLFAGQVDPGVSKRIYQVLSEVLSFQRATKPVPSMVRGLLRGADKYGVDDEVQHRLRNVLDHALRVSERIDSFRALLENALTLHATLVSQEQNEAMRRMTSASLAQGEESRQLARAAHRQGEEVKKISSWAAILFAPGLIAGVYGMNFDHMPELHWRYGYPVAIVGMLALMGVLWLVFRKRNWL